jgi:RHS repeat-associated protein
MDDDFETGIVKYQNGPGIDNKLRAQSGTSVSYFLSDHLGSTNGLTNSSGSLTSSNSYDSFGNPSNGAFPSRYGFTGREFDKFTGLQYSRARFYDPNLGRFISEDPIGFEGGDVNLYGYVWNDPLQFRDPYGLYPFDYPWVYHSDDEQVWRAQQDLIEAAAPAIRYGIGFGDTTLFGVSRSIRQWQGIDDPSLPCSVEYQAGEWTAIGVQAATGGVGLYRGGLALATGNVGERLFARHAKGLLNRNDYIRLGGGFERDLSIVPPTTGRDVFRLAIGSRRGKIHGHIRLWPFH